MTSILPRLRGNGSRRADDRIAELKAKHEDELQKLRGEMELLRGDNVRLLNRQAATDDFVAILKNDVVTANKAWVGERTRRENAETELVQAENVIRLRNRENGELKRRLQITVFAEAAATETQELDLRSLQERLADGPVRTLNQSPQARRQPGHVPGWVKDQPEPAA